ncbi:MAG: hypothetical protein EA427_11835 [Spirochaetaceae bacterium]|nr:MAG: hypothetical protein EA427_11835 [Spirochaetaceae bacterium]
MKAIKMTLMLYTVIVLGSCSFGTGPEIDTDTDNGTPSGFFLSSIDIEAGDVSGAGAAGTSSFGASAAVPHWDPDAGITIANGASGRLNNYPMRGQVTSYSVSVPEPEGQPDLFRVVSVTTYPFNPHIDNTTEIYFLKDTHAEPLSWRYVFSDSEGVENSLYREQYSTTYSGDYSIYSRDEEIVWDFSPAPEDVEAYGYRFSSRVEYEVSNRNEAFGFLNLTGTREYYDVDGSEERIVVTETGRITNMNWNGRIYRGNTDVEGKITLRIVDRELVEQDIQYTLTHRNLAQPIVITY